MTSSRSHGTFKSGLIGLGIMLVLVMLVCGCTQQAVTPPGTQSPTATQTVIGMPNPASVSCGQAGVLLRLKKIYPAMSTACALLRTGLPVKSGRSSAMRAANLR